MPRPRRPHKASPDEIKITREGDYAIIAYADENVATTHFKIGSEKLAVMTDEQILDFWNDGIEARDEFMAAQDFIAVEIPLHTLAVVAEQRCEATTLEPLLKNAKARTVPHQYFAAAAPLAREKEQITAQRITTESSLHQAKQTIVALAQIDRLGQGPVGSTGSTHTPSQGRPRRLLPPERDHIRGHDLREAIAPSCRHGAVPGGRQALCRRSPSVSAGNAFARGHGGHGGHG
jgi:hypothetical protein